MKKLEFKPEMFIGTSQYSEDSLRKIIGNDEFYNNQKTLKILAPIIAEIANIRFNMWFKENIERAPIITITGKKKELDVRYDALPENFTASLVNIMEV